MTRDELRQRLDAIVKECGKEGDTQCAVAVLYALLGAMAMQDDEHLMHHCTEFVRPRYIAVQGALHRRN